MYTGLNNLGLNSTQNVFSPSNLFSGGAQGVWYDPSDLTTMYQDSVGTTPVTAVEQPVGLILDKSRGALRGSELAAATYATPSGADNITTPTSATSFTQTAGTTAPRTYLNFAATAVSYFELSFTITAVSSGTVTFGLRNAAAGLGGNVQFVSGLSIGTFRYIFGPCGTTTPSILWTGSAAASTFSVSGVSVKEVAGNHASQATTTSRPTLSARYNQFTNSEFPNGVTDAPVRGGLLSVSAITGYTSALAFGYDGGVTSTFAYKTNFTTAANTAYTLSVVVTMDDGLGPPVFGSATLNSPNNDFYLIIGGSGSGSLPTSYQVTDLGGGRYRVTGSRTTGAADPNPANNGVLKNTGNSSRTFKVTAYDLRLAADVSALIPKYQRITTATSYDTVGFPFYLLFDGVDDCMATNTIDLTSTDKVSVIYGMGMHGTSTGILAEFGGSSTIAGSFSLYSPRSSGNPGMSITGTGSVRAGGSFTQPADSRNVISITGDFSGAIFSDEIKARVNGVVASTTTMDTTGDPTGTFGNLSLNLGRRFSGGVLPYLGRLYPLIVCGKLCSTTEIANTERYVATKTGVTL